MATHSSILAWRIPWTEELGGLQSTGHKELDMTCTLCAMPGIKLNTLQMISPFNLQNSPEG